VIDVLGREEKKSLALDDDWWSIAIPKSDKGTLNDRVG